MANEKIVLGFDADKEGWTTGEIELAVHSRAKPEQKMPVITTFRVLPDCLEITPEKGPDNTVIARVAVKEGATLPEDCRVCIHAEADPAPGLGAALSAMPGLPGMFIPKPFDKLSKDIDVQLVPYWLVVEADMPGEEPEDPTTRARVPKGGTLEQVTDGLAKVVVKARVFKVDAYGYADSKNDTPLNDAQWSIRVLEDSDYFRQGTPQVEEGGSVYSIPFQSTQPNPGSLTLPGKTLLKVRLQAIVPARGKIWMEFTLKALPEQPVKSFLGWIETKGGKYDYLSRLTGQVGREPDLRAALNQLWPSELREMNRFLTAYESDMAAYVQAHPKILDTASGGVRNLLNFVNGLWTPMDIRGCVDMAEKAKASLDGTRAASGKSSAFDACLYDREPGAATYAGWAGEFGAGMTAIYNIAKLAGLSGGGALITLGGVVVIRWVANQPEHHMCCLRLKRDEKVWFVLDAHGTQNGSPDSVHGPSYFAGSTMRDRPPPPPPPVFVPVGVFPSKPIEG